MLVQLFEQTAQRYQDLITAKHNQVPTTQAHTQTMHEIKVLEGKCVLPHPRADVLMPRFDAWWIEIELNCYFYVFFMKYHCVLEVIIE